MGQEVPGGFSSGMARLIDRYHGLSGVSRYQ